MKRICAWGMALIVSVAFMQVVWAQDSPTYAAEYALYEKANAETDGAKQLALIMEFIKTYKESALDPYIANLFAERFEPLRRGGSWSQLATLAEQYLEYRPTDVAATAAATEAYQKLGNTAKLVSFGTKLYNQAPNANTAYFVAKAYQANNDGANFVRWSQRVINHDPDNLEILVELMNAYWMNQDLAQATSYARKVLDRLADYPKPANQTDATWATWTGQVKSYAYRVLGEKSFVDNDLANAMKNFETAIQADKKNDFDHYRLGLINWRLGRANEAMMCFARAVVLNGSTSVDAKNQLTSLYQSKYGGKTTGIAALIEAARKELGI